MKKSTSILASTWNDGLFVIEPTDISHELPGHSVRGLSDDLEGGVFAVVDNHSLFRRDRDGTWNCCAKSEYPLSVTFALGDQVFVGTDDARVLLLGERGALEQIDSFDSIDGRNKWFAGTFMVDGKEVGPPLGIRSMSGASNGCLLANVHVGGIPRSVDSGATWVPTIDVELDVHEVRVSPYNNNLVVAASAAGLCISYDAGVNWTTHSKGLHDPYCSAVAVTRSNIFVACSEGHFTQNGAIYRRSIEPDGKDLEKVAGGLPNWLRGIADTSCIASRGDEMAIVSANGDVFLSTDAGVSWLKGPEMVAGVSSVQIVDSGSLLPKQ